MLKLHFFCTKYCERAVRKSNLFSREEVSRYLVDLRPAGPIQIKYFGKWYSPEKTDTRFYAAFASCSNCIGVMKPMLE